MLRGKFLLNNILGLPAPPPPPGVDTNLAEAKPDVPPPTIRERLAQHRTNPSCASCHSVIDPLGFALEHFDAIGAWRTSDESGRPVDAAARPSAAHTIEGLAGLRALLLASPNSSRAPSRRSCWPTRSAVGSSTTIAPPCAHDRPRCGGARLPLVGADRRHREESAVPDATETS